MWKVVSRLSTRRSLRRIVLPLLERFNPGDIHIRHHYTSQPVRLHAYRHKGYWFHGRRREASTMKFFQAVVRPGDTVVEVGGHIGYITMWLARLVGEKGRVLVFEPGENNLPYLRANVAALSHVEVLPVAVSNVDGEASFFEEPLTGQNNSLLADYQPFQENCRFAFSAAEYRCRAVRTMRLDTCLGRRAWRPDLIKIDIEGAEMLALAGAEKTLGMHLPMVMVEVTREADAVWRMLTRLGYRLFTPDGELVCDATGLLGNICAVHPLRHRTRLSGWPWSKARAA